MQRPWNIVEYLGFDGLRQLEDDWRRLLAEMPERGPQHAYETYVSYFRHFSESDGSFTCLALTDGERVRAICPLEPGRAETLPGRTMASVGLACWRHGLLLDVICPAGEAQCQLLPNAVRFLRRSSSSPSLLFFDSVLQDSALSRCLAGLGRQAYLTRRVGSTYVIPTDRPYHELLDGLTRKTRSNLRRGRIQLGAKATLRFTSASTPPELESALRMFLELEASGWKGEAGTRSAMRTKPNQMAFHRRLAATPWNGGRCEINTLHSGDVCVAAQFCVQAGAEYHVSRTAYDERFARFSPGQLLLEETLRRCCHSADVRRVSLVGDAEWLRVWRPECVPRRAVYLGLRRWSGPALVRLLRLRFRYGPRAKAWLFRFKTAVRAARRPRTR
jgi:CelD/BcsL family acetyltransferase involved in cellulose biosynthesis